MPNEDMNAVLTSLNGLHTGQILLQEGLTTLSESQTSFQRDIKSMQAELKTVQAELTSLKIGQAGVQESLANLDVRMTDGFGALDQKLITVRNEIMNRIDRLQGSVTSISEDIVVNMGAVTTVRQANSTTRVEVANLGDQVAAIWSQLKQLQQRVREITDDP